MTLTPELEMELRVQAEREVAQDVAYSLWDDLLEVFSTLDEARAERDRLGEAFGLRCKLAHEREDELSAERDRLSAACAEYRALLNRHGILKHPSNAGRDWVSPQVAEQAEKALREWYHSPWFGIKSAPNNATREALAALESARK